MRKIRILLCCLCLTMVFTNVSAFASGVTARISTQKIFVDGQQIDMIAYNIADNNYVRLRDIGKAVDFSVFYDTSTDSVRIDGSRKYIEGTSTATPTRENEITAIVSNQKIYVQGEPVAMTAYNIKDNNFVKLRDIGAAVNFSISYISETDSVYIDKSLPYGSEITEIPQPVHTPNSVVADGSGAISQTPFTEKIIDGRELCREDFSQSANPAIFDDVYTRGAYNAIRQSLVDRDIILQGNNADGFNPQYAYANFVDSTQQAQAKGKTFQAINPVISNIGIYHQITLGAEPNTKGYYNYPGYGIVKIAKNNYLNPANIATNDFFEELNKLTSDREKVVKLNSFLASKLTYKYDVDSVGINDIFISDKQSAAICADYATTFLYLCERASIPCIIVSGENHAWNIVYVDGKWLYVDVTNNDIGDDGISLSACLLAETYKLADENPKGTQFAKEILQPSSTK